MEQIEKTKEEKIREVIEGCRLLLQGHGGDCEIVSIDGDVVRMRLTGHCHGCPSAMATIKGYIELELKANVDPAIEVEPVMDEPPAGFPAE